MASGKKNCRKLTEAQMLIVAQKLCDKASMWFCKSRRGTGFVLFRKHTYGEGEVRNIVIAEPKTPASLLKRVEKMATPGAAA